MEIPLSQEKLNGTINNVTSLKEDELQRPQSNQVYKMLFLPCNMVLDIDWYFFLMLGI